MFDAHIEFFSEDTSFSLLNSQVISEWILQTVHSENFSLSSLNLIFCSDLYLLSINQEFLNHDYYTDVITFNNSDFNFIIDGDIFISIDRVRDNAINFDNTFFNELHRVIIHGVLHLIGYDDKLDPDKKLMLEKENYYLSLLKI